MEQRQEALSWANLLAVQASAMSVNLRDSRCKREEVLETLHQLFESLNSLSKALEA